MLRECYMRSGRRRAQSSVGIVYTIHTLSPVHPSIRSLNHTTPSTQSVQSVPSVQSVQSVLSTHHTHHTHHTHSTPTHTRTCMPAPGNDFIKFAPYPANIPARPSFTTICVIQSIVPV